MSIHINTKINYFFNSYTEKLFAGHLYKMFSEDELLVLIIIIIITAFQFSIFSSTAYEAIHISPFICRTAKLYLYFLYKIECFIKKASYNSFVNLTILKILKIEV